MKSCLFQLNHHHFWPINIFFLWNPNISLTHLLMYTQNETCIQKSNIVTGPRNSLRDLQQKNYHSILHPAEYPERIKLFHDHCWCDDNKIVDSSFCLNIADERSECNSKYMSMKLYSMRSLTTHWKSSYSHSLSIFFLNDDPSKCCWFQFFWRM